MICVNVVSEFESIFGENVSLTSCAGDITCFPNQIFRHRYLIHRLRFPIHCTVNSKFGLQLVREVKLRNPISEKLARGTNHQVRAQSTNLGRALLTATVLAMYDVLSLASVFFV